MKKILSAIVAAFMLSSLLLNLTVNAYSASELREMNLYRYDTLEGETLYGAYAKHSSIESAGYLYIMDNAEIKPAVNGCTKLSDITIEKHPVHNHDVYVYEHAMQRYGNNTYYSADLSQDKTGVAKIVEISSNTYTEGGLNPCVAVVFDYDTEAEYELNREELQRKINDILPQDGYGYALSEPIKWSTSGGISAKITSVAYEKGVDTEISEAFSNLSVDPFIVYEIADNVEKLDEVLYASSMLYTIDVAMRASIDSAVHYGEDIIYTLIYSAAPTNGDYNNDGLLEITDAQNLLTYSAAHVAGTTESLPIVSSAPENMDVDGDGGITIADAQYVLTYCAQQAAGMNPTWEDILK